MSVTPAAYRTIPIPPAPQNQGLTTKTFTLPPLDGSLTITEIYDFHLKNSADHPLFIFPEEDGTERVIKWGEAVRAIHRAGRIVQSHFDLQRQPGSQPPIVAILSAAGKLCQFCILPQMLRFCFG